MARSLLYVIMVIEVITVREGKISIQITTKTKERLVALGAKGDTYNDIIERLLDKEKDNA